MSGARVLPRYSSVPFTRVRARAGRFQFRYELPPDVHAALSKGATQVPKTIIFSLKTRDPLAARSRALRAAADIAEIVAAVRSGAPVRAWWINPARYQCDAFQAVLDDQADRLQRFADGLRNRASQPSGHGPDERLGASRVDDPERPKPSHDRPARERQGKRQGQRGGRASKGMTLLTVYNDVYLPRREERKGAPPRRRVWHHERLRLSLSDRSSSIGKRVRLVTEASASERPPSIAARLSPP